MGNFTTYTDQQIEDLCKRCKAHGITPPYSDRYIKDTIFDMMTAIMDLMDREADRERRDSP